MKTERFVEIVADIKKVLASKDETIGNLTTRVERLLAEVDRLRTDNLSSVTWPNKTVTFDCRKPSPWTSALEIASAGSFKDGTANKSLLRASPQVRAEQEVS